jgi:esterase/lipase superfamily enzyme
VNENPIVEKFKEFYQNKNATDLSKIDELYSDEIVFRDPIHQIRGLAALHDYMDDMYVNLSECRFEYLDQLVSVNSAYIKWNMHYRHPKFGNRLITVRGVSQINFDTSITFHEDIYDMGELIYEHVPLLGRVVRCLKHRLAKG